MIYCIDRCRFFDLSDDDDYMAPGYHETTIEWDADIDSDFINFYIGQNEDCNGVVYVSELKVEEVVPGETPADPTPSNPTPADPTPADPNPPMGDASVVLAVAAMAVVVLKKRETI